MKTLVREVDVEFIIDDMIEEGLLNDVEKTELQETKKVHKTRLLCVILTRNDKGNFRKFLEVISQEHLYPHVAKLLNKSYDEKLRDMENRIACIRCFIVQKVDIKQIMDHLCENLLIDMTDVEKVIQEDKESKQEFWGKIFEKISDPVWGETCVTILKEALEEHYYHIAKKIHCQQNLKCHCSSSSMSCNTGSVGDTSEVSTTSTVIPDRKSETDEWVERHTRPILQSPNYHITNTNILESKRTKKYILPCLHSENSEDREIFIKHRKRQASSNVDMLNNSFKSEQLRHTETERMHSSENKQQDTGTDIFRRPKLRKIIKSKQRVSDLNSLWLEYEPKLFKLLKYSKVEY